MSLRRVDLSSRGVLPCVMCLGVTGILDNGEALGHWGLLRHEKKETLELSEHNFIISTHKCQKIFMQILHIFSGKYLVSKNGCCVSKSTQIQKITDGKYGSVESLQNFEAI